MTKSQFRRGAAWAWCLLAASLAAQTGKLPPLDFKAIPADACWLVVLRPAPLFEHPELKKPLENLVALAAKNSRMTLDAKAVGEVAAVGFDGGKGYAVRTVSSEAGLPARLQKALKGEAGKLGGRDAVLAGPHALVADGDAVLYGKQEDVLRLLKPAAGEAPWTELLGTERAPILFAVDVAALLKANPLPPAPLPALQEFAAALDQTKTAVGRLKLDGDDFALEVVAACADAAAAEKLAAAVNGVVAFATAQLAAVPAQARQQAPPGLDAGKLFETAEAALRSMKAKADGKQATLTARAPAAALSVVTVMLFGVQAEAGARGAMQDNLKQIGLALHNYHDTHGSLPAAAWKGPDGKAKHAHSWRVASLPVIEQQALYDEYQFDEPWDSAANQAVAAKMPEVFRHPDDEEAKEKHYTNVFALVGGGAAWETDKALNFRDFTKGLSKTLLLATAQRKTVWNKPEDIDYDAKDDLPKLGGLDAGGYNVLMGDGSVQFLAEAIDEKALRKMISRADGG